MMLLSMVNARVVLFERTSIYENVVVDFLSLGKFDEDICTCGEATLIFFCAEYWNRS